MKKALKISLIVVSIILILSSLFIAIFINNIMGINKVKFDKEKLITVNQEVVMYDTNNNVIENNITNKNIVHIEDLSNNTINAFISIEDKTFFKHKGLNYKRICKAMYNNIKSHSFKEGASTISQQLIKNTHLSNEKTIKRKIKEMLLTKKLEKELSKKDILESYLNIIYFGENAYGIENASQTYFGKSAKELDLSESATLAGVIKSPRNYSPIYNKENCLKRRNLVLSEMLKDKKITPAQYDDAINSEINIVDKKSEKNINNVYIKSVINEAKDILNLSEKDLRIKGVKIYTYLDNDVQENLYSIANNTNNYHVNKYGNINDSLLIVKDNKQHSIIGLYGKSEYDLSNFLRQPGSAIKPILVYAPALEKGLINPKTEILDEPINYDGYSPNNVGGVYHGYVSVEKSICDSLNIPAVKVLDYVGINNGKNMAKQAGIKFSDNDNGLAIALGGFTNGTTLKELTDSYIPFVNDGKFTESKFIRKIIDKDGKTIYEHMPHFTQIMGDDTAYLMTDMLKEACKSGTSRKLSGLSYNVAGKTGTVAIKGTNNNTDAYSIAYTTEHTMGVWIGNYSNQPEYVLEGKNNGGTYATSMIKQEFENLYSDHSPKDFQMPNSVEEIDIDLKEYSDNHKIMVASTNCPDRYKIKIKVAKRYNNFEKSQLFENLTIDNFDIKVENDNSKITFNAKDYLKYDIVRIDDNKSKVIKNVSNKDGLITYYDTNIPKNKKVKYYVKISTIDDKVNAVSDTIEVYNKYESKYEKLSKTQDNLSWIFG